MTASLLGLLFTVVIAHFLALLSPGPDFVLVVRSALKHGKKNAVAIAAGIATANACYIALCLVGVGHILAASVPVLITLKIAGALFLLYLAFLALKAKRHHYDDVLPNTTLNRTPTTPYKEFATGFASGILNPKNLLFYLSLFTVVLTDAVGFYIKVMLGIWMTSLVFFWDVAIIYMLATPTVQRRFSQVAYYLDKCTGVILGLMGLSIIKSTLKHQNI